VRAKKKLSQKKTLSKKKLSQKKNSLKKKLSKKKLSKKKKKRCAPSPKVFPDSSFSVKVFPLSVRKKEEP